MSSLTFFFIFIAILAVLFLVVNLVLAPHNPYQEKITAFECGFHSFLQTRLPFNISFFIYALVYLLLDLEILLLFPYSVSAYVNNIYGLIVMLGFSLIITIGFIFELGKQALKISSQQTDNLISIKKSKLSIDHMGLFTYSKINSDMNQKRLYSTTSKSDLTPVKIYSDADSCKIWILKDNRGVAGVYRWVNINTGKSYIGSAIDLRERFTNYYNINHLMNNDSMLICRALIKYGYSDFRLEILEYCENPNQRFDKETFYIELYKPEYNILSVANTMPSALGRIDSKETKLKRSMNNPKRIMISVKDLLTNTETIYDSMNKVEKELGLLSGQVSQYFSKSQEKPLKKRYILTKVVREFVLNKAISEESWKAGVHVEVIDLSINKTTLYPSIREAARSLNIAHSTISNHMNNSKPYLGEYLFKKKEESPNITLLQSNVFSLSKQTINKIPFIVLGVVLGLVCKSLFQYLFGCESVALFNIIFSFQNFTWFTASVLGGITGSEIYNKILEWFSSFNSLPLTGEGEITPSKDLIKGNYLAMDKGKGVDRDERPPLYQKEGSPAPKPYHIVKDKSESEYIPSQEELALSKQKRLLIQELHKNESLIKSVLDNDDMRTKDKLKNIQNLRNKTSGSEDTSSSLLEALANEKAQSRAIQSILKDRDLSETDKIDTIKRSFPWLISQFKFSGELLTFDQKAKIEVTKSTASHIRDSRSRISEGANEPVVFTSPQTRHASNPLGIKDSLSPPRDGAKLTEVLEKKKTSNTEGNEDKNRQVSGPSDLNNPMSKEESSKNHKKSSSITEKIKKKMSINTKK